MKKYGWNIDEIKNLLMKGQNIKNNNELYDVMSKYSLIEFEIISIGYDLKNEDINFNIHTYYRIGEPKVNEMGTAYLPSYNFATEKREKGVSCISLNWLNSLKSVFFNITDERIEKDGIWEIKGIKIATGGDDEPLIIPVDWAKKTNFKSIDKVRETLENK